MIIAGIDPGVEKTGFGIIEYERGKASLLDCGCIKTSKKQSLPSRLSEIANDAKDLMLKHRPDAAVFEEVFFSKNVKTAIKVSHSRGVLMEALNDLGIPVYELNPMQIKMSVTGYGRAEKSQIKKMVKTLLNIAQDIRSDDAADALACALAFIGINPKINDS